MSQVGELIKVKMEPEFVVCHNNDDVELAYDPFAENESMLTVKEELIEPSFEDFNVNQVTVMQVKEDKTEEPDHDDFDYDNFNQNDDYSNDFDDHFNESITTVPTSVTAPVVNSKDVNEITIDEISTDLIKTEKIDELESSEKPTIKIKDVNEIKPNQKKIKAKMKEKGKKATDLNPDKRISGGKKKGRPKAEGEHKCVFCGKSYQYASLLKLHTRTHMIDKGHNCPICSRSFARSDHCKQHINNVHKGEVIDGVVRKPTFERRCEICAKVFFLYIRSISTFYVT